MFPCRVTLFKVDAGFGISSISGMEGVSWVGSAVGPGEYFGSRGPNYSSLSVSELTGRIAVTKRAGREVFRLIFEILDRVKLRRDQKAAFVSEARPLGRGQGDDDNPLLRVGYW